MEEEAQSFIDRHSLQVIAVPWQAGLPFVAYHGTVGQMDVHLVWAGRDVRYGVNNVATTASTLSVSRP